jgi:hypothetical protein
MKARNENNGIKVYPNLPNDWGNILNLQQADNETLEANGFFDLVTPEINHETEYLGGIYFDENESIFTYPVIQKTASQIAYETAMKGWHSPEFSLRIIAPDALLLQAPGVETWARYQGLTVIVENGFVYLYCDIILPQHSSLLEEYQNLITIETRPTL